MIDIASPKPIELEDAVHDYVSQMRTPFTTDDALPDIIGLMTAPPSDPWTAVDEALMQSEWLFCDEMKDIYVPRCRFFQGAQFLITPQPEEIQANILIPGHRFMPFLERSVFLPEDGNVLVHDAAGHPDELDLGRARELSQIDLLHLPIAKQSQRRRDLERS